MGWDEKEEEEEEGGEEEGGGKGRRERRRRAATVIIEGEGRKQDVARWRIGCMSSCVCEDDDNDNGKQISDVLYVIPPNMLKCCLPTSI